MSFDSLWEIIGLILIALGVIGSVLPVMPGATLIFIGALVWAWNDGFQALGWPMLIVLGVLTLLAWGIQLLLAPAISRRAGASWRAIGGAVAGGLFGGAILSGIPVIGTLFGALLGAVIGMWFVEYSIKGDAQAATEAVTAYVASTAVGAILNLMIAVLMVALFVWQAFF